MGYVFSRPVYCIFHITSSEFKPLETSHGLSVEGITRPYLEGIYFGMTMWLTNSLTYCTAYNPGNQNPTIKDIYRCPNLECRVYASLCTAEFQCAVTHPCYQWPFGAEMSQRTRIWPCIKAFWFHHI